ncbi:hypothetical protein [Pseudocitrobacter corydidari]
MSRKEKRIVSWKQHEVMDYVVAGSMPVLALLTLYFASDYFPPQCLTQAPDFISVSLLKANFVSAFPLFLALSWRFNKTLYFTQRSTTRAEKTAYRILISLTLALIVIANTLIFTLHFTLFSPENYIRCWEPYSLGTWHYAKTADLCVQHGLEPVRFLSLAE